MELKIEYLYNRTTPDEYYKLAQTTKLSSVQITHNMFTTTSNEPLMELREFRVDLVSLNKLENKRNV